MLNFLGDKKKKVLEGCGNSSKVTTSQGRDQHSGLHQTSRGNLIDNFAKSLHVCFALHHKAKKRGGGYRRFSLKLLNRDSEIAILNK